MSFEDVITFQSQFHLGEYYKGKKFGYSHKKALDIIYRYNREIGPTDRFDKAAALALDQKDPHKDLFVSSKQLPYILDGEEIVLQHGSKIGFPDGSDVDVVNATGMTRRELARLISRSEDRFDREGGVGDVKITGLYRGDNDSSQQQQQQSQQSMTWYIEYDT
jgi:hypothetical protein